MHCNQVVITMKHWATDYNCWFKTRLLLFQLYRNSHQTEQETPFHMFLLLSAFERIILDFCLYLTSFWQRFLFLSSVMAVIVFIFSCSVCFFFCSTCPLLAKKNNSSHSLYIVKKAYFRFFFFLTEQKTTMVDNNANRDGWHTFEFDGHQFTIPTRYQEPERVGQGAFGAVM